MTPLEYFTQHPNACSRAQDFCKRFESMRDAWMSDDVLCSWMLWAIVWDPVARPAVLKLGKLLASSPENKQRQRYIEYLYDKDAAYYGINIESQLWQMAVDAGVVERAFQEMIRKVLPDMFNEQPKDKPCTPHCAGR